MQLGLKLKREMFVHFSPVGGANSRSGVWIKWFTIMKNTTTLI